MTGDRRGAPMRPTDTLANERTFLAWVRTALAFIAFGFVIARFALFAREFSAIVHEKIAGVGDSTFFGIAVVIVGIAVALYGAYRYAATERALRSDQVLSMPPWAGLTAGTVVALIGVAVAVALSLSRVR
jgi:putative membrane protein